MVQDFEIREITNITINDVVFPIGLFNIEASNKTRNDLRCIESIKLDSTMTGSKLKDVFPNNEFVASLEDNKFYELRYEKEYIR